MDKKVIMLGMVLGSVAGGYIPSLFGISSFSLTSVFTSALGGFFGIWLSFKLLN